MRIRTIKPEFFTSRKIDSLPLTAQRTFIGLWCYADDEGRGLDDPHVIKGLLWPHRNRHSHNKLSGDLDAIACAGLIERYEVEGLKLFFIVGFKEHQRINKPSRSRLPAPPVTTTSGKGGVLLPDSYRGELGTRKGNREQGTGIAPRRAKDDLFESVATACGLDWNVGLTKSARGALNAAVSQLRDIGAEPSEVALRARNYARLFPNAALTPSALAKHWPQLQKARAPDKPKDRFASMAEDFGLVEGGD